MEKKHFALSESIRFANSNKDRFLINELKLFLKDIKCIFISLLSHHLKFVRRRIIFDETFDYLRLIWT